MAKRKQSSGKSKKIKRNTKPTRKAGKARKRGRRRSGVAQVAATPVPTALARLKLDLQLPRTELDLDLNIPLDIGDPQFKLPPLTAITAPLSIVGIIPTSTLINASNADTASLTERFDVPAETQFAVPMLMGSMHGFAKATLSAQGKLDIPAGVVKARLFADLLTVVTIENLLDPAPPSDRKKLEVKVSAVLQSGREREDWFAVVSYTLLLLRLGSGG